MRRQKDTSYTEIRHAKIWEEYNVLKVQYGDVFKDLPRSRINGDIGDKLGYNSDYIGQVINKLIKKHGN
jgi:hypothetical protein